MSEYGGRLAQEASRDTTLRDYIKSLKQFPLTDGRANRALAKRARRGDTEARRMLIEANQGLLLRCVGPYLGMGIPAMDLLMSGATGLTIAADKYDPTDAAAFSHFAWYYIKGCMLRECYEQLAPTGMPEHMFYKWLRLRKANNGQAVNTGDISANDRIAIGKHAGKPISLDIPYDAMSRTGDPSNTADTQSIGDFLVDDAPEVDSGLLGSDLRSVLEQHITRLNSTEQMVIRFRFWDELTQAQIAHKLGFTGHQRVSQIEERALRKLRGFMTLANYVAG